jgi:outer membrane protein TolC
MKNLIILRRFIHILLTVSSLLLAACTSYQSQPLDDQLPLATDLKMLQQNKSHYEIDPGDGLDLTEVAILAVLGNPELRANRAKLEVVGAQAFAAGLLPDPQLIANIDKPTGDDTGLVNAWGAGLSFDIVPLITRQARIDAEQNTNSQIRLELLWQEWQVIQRAQTLAVNYQLEQQRLALLHDMRNLFKQRFEHSKGGLIQGNITLDINGTDLTALLDTFSQISQLEQTHNQTRHDLSLLLGVQSDASFTIASLPEANTLDKTVIQNQLHRLPEIRPDLLALKAGYQSQEDRVRAAILAQFPSISLGISRARDTGNINTTGLTIGLTLPVFSGNRGAIAIERATRTRLQREYELRLAQTSNDAERLLAKQAIITGQRSVLKTYLPTLKSIVDRSRSAYERGDIDALVFLNLETTLLNKRLEAISLEQSQWEINIALRTLLALPDNEAAQLMSAHTTDSNHE